MQGAIVGKPSGAKAFPPPSSLMLMSVRRDTEQIQRRCKRGLLPRQSAGMMVYHPNHLPHVLPIGAVIFIQTYIGI